MRCFLCFFDEIIIFVLTNRSKEFIIYVASYIMLV